MAGVVEDVKQYRTFGFDVIINNFEPLLREFVRSEIFHKKFPDDWKPHVPRRVIYYFEKQRKTGMDDFDDVDEFFEEVTLPNLKDLILKEENFEFAKDFIGDLSKGKFTRLMNRLNAARIKIAHAKSSYSQIDFSATIAVILELCQGLYTEPLKAYLEENKYTNAKGIPKDFFEDYECQENLPREDYDTEGGFVGRETEIDGIMTLIRSEQDRIITITGAGGAGKTAIALKVAYSFLEDEEQIFEAIIWFSAKNTKLTDEGISPLDPQISSYQQLIQDIFKILDPYQFAIFTAVKVPLESWVNYLNKIFSDQKCLLIIDNLETIYAEKEIINFIKKIPRPSCVLITSRRGLGEIENRYPIGDLPEADAIKLFTVVSESRGRKDLVNLPEGEKVRLVKKVRCYPLLIKWSIGQACLGKDLDLAFSEILDGDSEIAKFSFNDVFALLSEDAKKILYSMIIFGPAPITRELILHLTNLDADHFSVAINELQLSSLVFLETVNEENQEKTKYNILTLTRGFVESKLDEDERTRIKLITRFHDLSDQIKELEKSVSDYTQTYFKLGIKTPEQKVGVNNVKSALANVENNDFVTAEKFFKKAAEIAPDLPYVWTEYSKFEFQRGHIPQALGMAKKAVDAGPNNALAWWNYGLLLKKAKKYPEAIPIFEKAKELNPDYLPNYSELAHVYSLLGRYEEAEQEFKAALKEEKFPNFRQKMFTLLNRAENYRAWAGAFKVRDDYPHQIEMLQNAFDTMANALELKPFNRILLRHYRFICLDLGIALGYQMKDEAEKYLQKAMELIEFDYGNDKPPIIIVATANYYLAFFGKRNGTPSTTIEKYIDSALSSCPKGTELHENILKLQRSLKNEVEDKYNPDNKTPPQEDNITLEPSIDHAANLIIKAIKGLEARGKKLLLTEIKTEIVKTEPNFAVKTYGFIKLKDLVQELIDRQLLAYRIKIESKVCWLETYSIPVMKKAAKSRAKKPNSP